MYELMKLIFCKVKLHFNMTFIQINNIVICFLEIMNRRCLVWVKINLDNLFFDKFVKLFWSAQFDDPSFVEKGNPVAELFNFSHVVGCE